MILGYKKQFANSVDHKKYAFLVAKQKIPPYTTRCNDTCKLWLSNVHMQINNKIFKIYIVK